MVPHELTPLARRLAARSRETPHGCWEWFGATDPAGYGAVKIDGRKVNAHKAMHEALHGPVAPGQVVRHTCNNPRCIRPDHLKPGTRRQNLEDAKELGYEPFATKLSQEAVQAIIDDPRPAATIAKSLGITTGTVYRIKSHRQPASAKTVKLPFRYKFAPKKLARAATLALILVTLQVASAATAASYYIAPGGNDSSGAGTLANPWRSHCRAQSVLNPGDTLFARGGTYNVSSTGCDGYSWSRNGTSSAKITFRNYQSEVPVFDGQYQEGHFIILDTERYVEILGLRIQHWNDSFGNGALQIEGSAHHITVTGNTFFENGQTRENDHHIYLSDSAADIVIRRNVFDTTPGGAVHTYGGPGVSRVNIVNNFFKNNYWGIVSADGANNFNIHNNTFYNNAQGSCSRGASLSLNGHGSSQVFSHNVRNNIFFQSDSCHSIIVASRDLAALQESNNLIFGTNKIRGKSLDATDITGNPLFVTAGNDQLQAGSPAVNAGVTLSTVSTDRLSVARPQGAAYDLGSRER